VAYWLVKTEPGAYSFADLQAKQEDMWEGVRNYQARNFLQQMQVNDAVLVYHSGKKPQVVGTATVSKAAYADPTAPTQGTAWVAIDLKAGQTLPQPVSLKQIKGHEALQNMALLKQSRLSVVPLTQAEHDLILALSKYA